MACSKKGILTERKYTLDLLKEIGMLRSKHIDTSIDANLKIETRPGEKEVNKKGYQKLVRKLISLPQSSKHRICSEPCESIYA